MSENTVADQNDPAAVAIAGGTDAAQSLASDLVARGVALNGGARFRVNFDASDARTAAVFRDGSEFFAGAAARPGLDDPTAAMLADDDARNLGWKLALVLQDKAPPELLDSYETERAEAVAGAPVDYAASPLTSQFGLDKKFRAGPPAGGPMTDMQVQPVGYDAAVALSDVCGIGFAALFFTGDYDALPPALADGLRALETAPVPVATIIISASADATPAGFPLIVDADRALHRRYGAMTGAFYLLRPDRVVAARWQHPSLDAISAALRRATGHTDASAQPPRSSGW